jgi:uncharacterized repeat protein (TIGR03833 family)
MPENDRGRGRSGGRGGFQGGRDRPNLSQSVPNRNQVIPGTFVSIVLKVDQPTGREVQGIVADVLTNGNHPRGIKVRLVDGRVGRVQTMVSEDTATAGSDGLNGLGRNGEHSGQSSAQAAAQQRSRISARYHDVREEEEMAIPASSYSLVDFLPAGHLLRDDPPALASGLASMVHTCPVCCEFDGDEVAVSHHVATHFE